MAPSRISPPPADPGLTAAQLTTFEKDGYLIIPDALSPDQVRSLLAETHDLLTAFDLTTHPLTRFSTRDSGKQHVGDDYFLTSHDKVRFFFEEDAFTAADPSQPDGATTLSKPKHLAINKIGHGLHSANAAFRAATLTPRHAALARACGLRDPRVLQSMVICKQPAIGGRVPPHQDSTFLFTDPPSALGFWFALEDCSAANGCLSFAPGSHRRAPVRERFVRLLEGGTGFEANEGGRWPRGLDGVEGEEGEAEEEYVLGECKAGSLVLIHGNLLHKSEKNTSAKGRMIYTFHCIEGENRYDERNWLRPPEGGFTRLKGGAEE